MGEAEALAGLALVQFGGAERQLHRHIHSHHQTSPTFVRRSLMLGSSYSWSIAHRQIKANLFYCQILVLILVVPEVIFTGTESLPLATIGRLPKNAESISPQGFLFNNPRESPVVIISASSVTYVSSQCEALTFYFTGLECYLADRRPQHTFFAQV